VGNPWHQRQRLPSYRCGAYRGDRSLGPQAATALAVGFLGAFTTYSTFAWETFTLGRTDRILLAACYLTASVVLGVLSAALGHWLGRVLMQ